MSSVTDALQVEMDELDTKIKTLRNDRDAEIKAAKDKYALGLKAGMAKRGKLKRMMKTATEQL